MQVFQLAHVSLVYGQRRALQLCEGTFVQWKPDRRTLLAGGGGLSTGLTGPLWDRGQSSE